MPKLRNNGPGTIRYQMAHVWHEGEVRDVPQNVADSVMAAQPGRFEVIGDASGTPESDEPPKAVTPDRQQKRGRLRKN